MEFVEPMQKLSSTTGKAPDLAEVAALGEKVRAHLSAQVVGRDAEIDLVVTALLAGGHVLLEDYPGSGKTTLAKALGAAFCAPEAPRTPPLDGFRRIQFTPDLVPSDITGVTVFEPTSGRFRFRPGPVFTHVLLADEINRASPKVQAALLEVMAERQVTVDEHTYPLDPVFLVLATQNPSDVAGTYPLPTPQLDRFLFRIRMKPLPASDELSVLRTMTRRAALAAESPAFLASATIRAARGAVEQGVHIDPRLEEALVGLAGRLRVRAPEQGGISTRALVLAVGALKTAAALQSRDFVAVEDLDRVMPPLLTHRLSGAIAGGTPEELVAEELGRTVEEVARVLRRA